MALVLSSAEGILSVFKENESQYKVLAVKKLCEVVDFFWHEIADYLTEIQTLAFDPTFPEHELAAYLASQIHYHLEQYSEALELALESGPNFDLSLKTPYVQTLVRRCIDEYVAARVKNYESKIPEDKVRINPKMEDVVERMFQRCFQDGEFQQAIGIALETRRVDMLQKAIQEAPDTGALLNYAFHLAKQVVASREFRTEVIATLAALHKQQQFVDHSAYTDCMFLLNDYKGVADTLAALIETDKLLALQIAFDLAENQNQKFLNEVLSALPATTEEEEVQNTRENVKKILAGTSTIEIYLEFLHSKSKTDKLLVSNLKNAVEAKNSVTHGGVIIANAFLNSGTADDSFLRENLDWVARATNWSKFSAAASLGVIHRGNIYKSKEILQPYLPGAAGGSPYSEGGALYALGLIHANHMHTDTLNYLINALQANSGNETVLHGACLGIGLLAMATADMNLFEQLKTVLYSDSAVASEAASYAMGLIMMGSANEVAIQEMLSYAHETQHEKIIRALAIGLAMIMYAKEEEADTLITQLITEKDAILRYGGAYAFATAYAGSANPKVIKKLLHIAVSDVDYDVRRAAVTALGFVLHRKPDQLPKVIALLCESYNPYVRQGAAMALGVACGGKATPEAVTLLEKLQTDSVNFVRQAAYIASGMVLMQTNKQSCPKVEKFRENLDKLIGDKHQEALTKMGAVIGYGILDCGGRNSSIALESASGNNRAAAIAGLVISFQFWYWFPLIHTFSLALSPTSIIGLNQDLKIPQSCTFVSKAKPSLFAYPPKLEPPSSEKTTKLSAVVLSTTNKVKARAAMKAKPEDKDAMDIDETRIEEESKKEEAKKEEAKKDEPEPDEEVLNNPSRVLKSQEKFIEFTSSRYTPVSNRKSGILLLRDHNPHEPEVYVGQPVESQPLSQPRPMDLPEEFEFDPIAQQKAFS